MNSEQRNRKKSTKLEDMTKEQIKQAILRKRECNAKAQNIVESLLETSITEEYFKRCLPDINQNHLDDVIEERSITHLCGYPLCNNDVSQTDIPKQKYRISLKTNKVYDITSRKNFCSNTCYKAAMHIKKQMLTSPLWFREYEVIPTFQLLNSDTIGSLGQEIDFGSNTESLKPFTSINEFANISLSDITIGDEKNENTLISDKPKEIDSQTVEHKMENETHNQNEQQINEICTKISDLEVVPQNKDNTSTKLKKPPSNVLNIVGEIVEKPTKPVDPIIAQKIEGKLTNKSKAKHKKQPVISTLTAQIERCLAEWLTLETMLFLFGEERVKEMVADKNESLQNYLSNISNSIAYTSHSYDQYQELCRKLNILDLEDRKLDSSIMQKETKPLPNYDMIKEESRKIELKVKAFISGETETPQLNEQAISVAENLITHLPLVDKTAQNALRRRIVCQNLNKVLPDLLSSLGLVNLSLNSDIRLLVNTFKLKANNIMFKPLQWTIIVIVVLKLLSIRDKRLDYLMKQPMAFQHMQLLLLSYNQDGGYLDRLVIWLTDIDRLLDVKDTTVMNK